MSLKTSILQTQLLKKGASRLRGFTHRHNTIKGVPLARSCLRRHMGCLQSNILADTIHGHIGPRPHATNLLPCARDRQAMRSLDLCTYVLSQCDLKKLKSKQTCKCWILTLHCASQRCSPLQDHKALHCLRAQHIEN